MKMNDQLTISNELRLNGKVKLHGSICNSALSHYSRNESQISIKNLWTLIGICIFNFFIYQNSICQTNDAILQREELPSLTLKKSLSAPGYCESTGGSTTYESISSVHVIEKQGNLLDITVDVFIANPTGCQSGEPCPIYDSNPENVNAWIDWNGNQKWEPNEKVLDAALTSYNINYGKTMTAKASVQIPSNAVRPTYLRANLGWGYDPEDPCQSYWSYGNVKDQQVLGNIKVKEIKATLNIGLADVPKPLWQATYNESGNMTSLISNTPLAVGMKNGWFTLPVEFVSFPENLSVDFKTDCNWEILGTSVNGLAGITGKSGVMSITLPQKIGFYDLQLKFVFKNNNGNHIGEQVVTLPLWVSYNTPQLSSIKKIWLQKAIEWTEGTQMSSNAEDELAVKTMHGIYSKSGWQYYSYNFNWSKLVEGLETSGGNCHVVANVWLNLLKTLGVGGISTVTHSGEVTNKGFMVIPNVKAFGSLPSANGNAAKNYSIYPTYDRWVFDGHTFGQIGNKYYDPTFNITGTTKYFHVAHDILGATGGVIYTNAGGPTLKLDGSSRFEEGWPMYIYEYSLFEKSVSSQPKANLDARFTGSFSETLIDLNNDGIFDQLTGKVGIEITNPGNYLVTGLLRKDDNFITAQSYYASPLGWFETVGAQTGVTEVQAIFSGERIFAEAMDGPYIFELQIIDSTGARSDTAIFITSMHDYRQFGELPARILNLSETAVDTLGNGYFNIIRINSSISSNYSGTYPIQKTLSHQGQILFSESESVVLNSGSNALIFSLDAQSISISGLDGPYTLSLQVLDQDGNQVDYKEIQTSNYLASQFSPPKVKITSGVSDQGIDINSNALFDALKIYVNLEVTSAGTYTVLAWLEGTNGEDITSAGSQSALGIGANFFSFNFPGTDINKSQLNGPYKIGYTVITDDSANLIFSKTDIYTTQNYNASQFEESKSQIISSTGIYSESSIDNDANGLIDTLVVEVEVTSRDSGNVVAIGRLVDSENETILWSSTTEFLHENSPQFLHLKFDAKYIYGGMVGGPYQLKDLQIYHVGDPSQTVDIQSPYTTQNYKYIDFEKTEVITGTISDVNNNPVQNALLIIINNDYDYSNNQGKYNLVLFNRGEFDIKIEGPDSLDIEWSIFLNGNFLKTGDSLRVFVDSNQIVNIDFKAQVVLGDVEDLYSDNIPDKYFLKQNFPNPYNPSTKISWQSPVGSWQTLKIYDVLGNEVATLVDEYRQAGSYEVEFNAANLASGIYLYRIQAGSFIETKNMILIR